MQSLQPAPKQWRNVNLMRLVIFFPHCLVTFVEYDRKVGQCWKTELLLTAIMPALSRVNLHWSYFLLKEPQKLHTALLR